LRWKLLRSVKNRAYKTMVREVMRPVRQRLVCVFMAVAAPRVASAAVRMECHYVLALPARVVDAGGEENR